MNKEQNGANFTDWNVFGHNGPKRILNNFVQQSEQGMNIPHAFLFTGPKGIGKADLAIEFAKKLSGQNQVFRYDVAENNSVEQLRELIQLSSLGHISGAKNIFILENFEQASIASSNAFLKTLEEPSSTAMFLLIANQAKILPTIMSRCLIIRCYPNKHESINALPANLQTALANYPTYVEKFLSDPEKTEKFERLLTQLLEDKVPSKLLLVTPLSELDPTDLKELLMLWIGLQTQKLDKIDVVKPTVFAVQQAVSALESLRANVNTKLVLQEFLLKI